MVCRKLEKKNPTCRKPRRSVFRLKAMLAMDTRVEWRSVWNTHLKSTPIPTPTPHPAVRHEWEGCAKQSRQRNGQLSSSAQVA